MSNVTIWEEHHGGWTVEVKGKGKTILEALRDSMDNAAKTIKNEVKQK